MAMIDLRVLAAWWDTFEDPPGYRAEVIRGELVLSPSASRAHKRAVMELAVILRRSCPAGYEVLPDLEWRFDERGMVAQAPRPDLMVARTATGPIVEAPLLVVEVLSRSDHQVLLGVGDVSRIEGKILDYSLNGLRHYLEITLEPLTATLFELVDGREEILERAETGTLSSDVPFLFGVRLADLL